MANRILDCRELIAFLADYLDGELAPEVRDAFELHLSLCPACVDYLANYRETLRLERRAFEADAGIPDDVPEELVAAILAARRR